MVHSRCRSVLATSSKSSRYSPARCVRSLFCFITPAKRLDYIALFGHFPETSVVVESGAKMTRPGRLLFLTLRRDPCHDASLKIDKRLDAAWDHPSQCRAFQGMFLLLLMAHLLAAARATVSTTATELLGQCIRRNGILKNCLE
jgi:hypothetical protein